MAIAGLQRKVWSFDEIALNLADSTRHLKPDEARIIQDIDFDDQRGGLVGRYGTKTLNVAADGTPDPLAQYQMYDLFRATDTDTDKKYIIGVYDDTVNYKIAALCTTDGDKAFTTIAASGGGAFNLSRGNRVSFMNVREPNLNDVIVMGTNGTDQPFYFKGTGGITSFQFGAIGDFRLKYFLERPWRGHSWAALRAGEETTVHWSDAENFLTWVETEGSGFRQCPQDDLLNVFRGFRIHNDRLMVFNLDSIGEIYHTGNTANPFRFRELHRDNGAIHNRAIAVHGPNIWFLDKRAPYLKYWNGHMIREPRSADTITEGIEKWADLDDWLNVRLTVRGSTLLVAMKTRPVYAPVGTDGNRWVIAISLDKEDRNKLPYHPMSLWKIRANDIISVDEGTDFGQTYFSDAQAQNIGGTDYYFLRRICDWYDFRKAAGEEGALGDGNGITGVNATEVDNILQTGWWALPGNPWFELMWVGIDAEWEGTPSANKTITIGYRFDEETSFQNIVFTAVNGEARYPVAGNAQGRRMQMRFTYSDNQSRPILHRVILWYRLKRGILN